MGWSLSEFEVWDSEFHEIVVIYLLGCCGPNRLENRRHFGVYMSHVYIYICNIEIYIYIYVMSEVWEYNLGTGTGWYRFQCVSTLTL